VPANDTLWPVPPSAPPPPRNRSAYAPDKCCEAKDTDAQTHGCQDTRAVRDARCRERH